MTMHPRDFRQAVGNSGRRYGAEALAADRLVPMVRLTVESPQAQRLRTVTDSMTSAEARALGNALLRAAAIAEHEHEAATRPTTRRKAG